MAQVKTDKKTGPFIITYIAPADLPVGYEVNYWGQLKTSEEKPEQFFLVASFHSGFQKHGRIPRITDANMLVKAWTGPANELKEILVKEVNKKDSLVSIKTEIGEFLFPPEGIGTDSSLTRESREFYSPLSEDAKKSATFNQEPIILY